MAAFEAEVAKADKRTECRPCEVFCATVFYLVMLGQLVLFIMVFTSQNAVMVDINDAYAPGSINGGCPEGFKFRFGVPYCLDEQLYLEHKACMDKGGNIGSLMSQLFGSGFNRERRLMNDDGMQSMNLTYVEHLRKLSTADTPTTPKNLLTRQLAARRLQSLQSGGRTFIPADLWQFLEEWPHMPSIVFSATTVLASFWLLGLAKVTGPIVWATLGFDIMAMVGALIYSLIELEEFNFMCAALIVIFSIGLVVFRAQIQTAIVVMHKAMAGLSDNGRLFPISYGVTVLWIVFFAGWIASLITMDLTKKINPTTCAVENGYAGELRIYWIVSYFWSTYFFNNAKLIVITCQLGEWYFKGDGADKGIWCPALGWSFHPSKVGGANAICSFIMGATQFLMVYINSKCRMVAAMFNPIEWIPLCIAFCLKEIIHTYTKFGLVAAAFSGQPFCTAAGNTFQLLKTRLGEAIICDYVGKKVMGWCTYLLSLGVAMAALFWGNSLQNVSEANEAMAEPAAMVGVMLLLSYFVNMPLFSIVIIVLIETLLDDTIHQSEPKIRAIINSVFASIFMGSVTNFLLKTMSHIVVSAMDVVYFCYALEQDLGQKQERFEDLYEAIKKDIPTGIIASGNQGVVVGAPPGGQQVIPVQIPEGVGPGAMLQVPGPNGPIQAQVPLGMSAGQVFNVSVPAVVSAEVVAVPNNVVGVPQQEVNPNATVVSANNKEGP